jgi:hypothetical protein
MRIINVALLLFACAAFMSCGNRMKQVAEVQETTSEQDVLPSVKPPANNLLTFVGVIDYDDACGHIIRVTMDDKEITFAPLNLEEVYKKQGMRVRFSLNPALDESKKCATHYRITLDRITPLRG